jgi:hypothetical protein
MTEKERQQFEQREAIQYLFEDNELACIELTVRVGDFRRNLKLDDRYLGIRGREAPALLFGYLCELMRRQYLAETDFIRERTNTQYLLQRARELWQK